MSTLQIPSITIFSFQDDLQAFQAKHFPGQLQHTSALQDTFDETAFAEGEDDLGYYPDGVKRTLTDEEIQILRHSEIHSILRQRELQEESEDADESVADENLDDADQKRNDTTTPHDQRTEISISSSPKGSDHNGKITSHANVGSESGALDYGEDRSNQNHGQAKSSAASNPAFPGRRIISYAED
ncbi:hypothetical protein PHISP_05046 [Aspergillus sp. HF37]|nr:hypothetical protein PHISP_05046 [Aspergillus sp. HF37]